MNNIAVVEHLVDRILVQDLERALELVAEDGELVVLPPDPGAGSPQIEWGKQALRDYFGALGGIVTFWQVRVVADGDQVLVLGREHYVTTSGLESNTEFMLDCQVEEGLITRLLVVEDVAVSLGDTPEHIEAALRLRPTVFRDVHPPEEALVFASSRSWQECTVPDGRAGSDRALGPGLSGNVDAARLLSRSLALVPGPGRCLRPLSSGGLAPGEAHRPRLIRRSMGRCWSE